MREERFNSSINQDEGDELRLRDKFSETVARLFRGAESEDASEEDEDKKKRRKKSKSARWRRFMRGMFSRPLEDSEKEAPEKGSRFTSFLPFISLEKVDQEASGHKIAHAQEAAENNAVQSGAAEPEALGETIKKDDPETEAAVSQQQAENQPPLATEAARSFDRNEPSHEDSFINEQEQGVLHIQRQQDESTDRYSPSPSPQERPSVQQKTRDAGARQLAVGLAGMEYLGRKRADRKLESEQRIQAETAKEHASAIERQAEELKETNKKFAEQDLRYKSATQAEALRARRGIESAEQASKSERPPVVPPPIEQLMSRPIEQKPAYADRPKLDSEAKKREVQPELSPDNERASRIERELKERQLSLDREEAEYNEKVYENAERAAAHGVPVEKFYERRHEVKEVAEDANKPVSVGTIIRDRQPLQRPGAGNVNGVNSAGRMSTLSTMPASNTGSTKHTDNAMYLQAAKSGFFTAIVIIAIAIVLAFL